MPWTGLKRQFVCVSETNIKVLYVSLKQILRFCMYLRLFECHFHEKSVVFAGFHQNVHKSGNNLKVAKNRAIEVGNWTQDENIPHLMLKWPMHSKY